jgi:hypothetical protein
MLDSVFQIEDQRYEIELTMFNPSIKAPFYVPFKTVRELVIEESLMNWNVKGYITIQSDYEVIERGVPPTRDEPNGRNPLFVFRTDGRNKLNIRIYTIGPESLPKDKWEMNFDCVIYDIEDLPTDSAIRKIRKYYFYDERYQIFSERNISWSTSTHGPASKIFSNTPAWLLPDSQKAMNANVALASVIDTASNNNFDLNGVGLGTPTKVGFTGVPSNIANPTIKLNSFDDQNWELGTLNVNQNPSLEKILQYPSVDGSSIIYTSPANNTVLDDMDYILDYCKGGDDSPIFLTLGRHTEDKRWKLRSLKTLFSSSENEQVEKLVLDDGLLGTINKARSYEGKSDLVKNFMSGKASKISNYKFVPMTAMDDNLINNKAVHSYDFSTGSYNIYMSLNKAENVLSKMEETAKAGLFNFQQSNKGQILYNINQTKFKGLSMENYFGSTQPFAASHTPLVHMLKDLLFLNEALYFRGPGLTLRAPGRFLYVTRKDSAHSNYFDDRFLGQWLMIKVTHYFSPQTYLTDVVATKVDSAVPLWKVKGEDTI